MLAIPFDIYRVGKKVNYRELQKVLTISLNYDINLMTYVSARSCTYDSEKNLKKKRYERVYNNC